MVEVDTADLPRRLLHPYSWPLLGPTSSLLPNSYSHRGLLHEGPPATKSLDDLHLGMQGPQDPGCPGLVLLDQAAIGGHGLLLGSGGGTGPDRGRVRVVEVPDLPWGLLGRDRPLTALLGLGLLQFHLLAA